MAVEIVVVDASIWVARLIPQDLHHGRVAAWMAAFAGANGRYVAPSLLLAEVGGAIARRTGRSDLAERAIESLRQFEPLTLARMDDRLITAAAGLAIRLSLRGADSVYVALAARLRLPLLSLDAEHAGRASRAVKVIEP